MSPSRTPLRRREPTGRNRGHLTILDAMDDENLFAPHFDNAESWMAWRAFLAVLFGLALDQSQRELFRQCTGREHINSEGHHEAWMVIGRRGGKSFALALIAVFLACFKDWQAGGRSDSMTLAIGHRGGNISVIDAIREVRPPFSPESAVGEFAQLLKRYRISRIEGDRYGGEWPVEQFRRHGLTYEAAPKPKSDLYRDLLASVNSKLVDLV